MHVVRTEAGACAVSVLRDELDATTCFETFKH